MVVSNVVWLLMLMVGLTCDHAVGKAVMLMAPNRAGTGLEVHPDGIELLRATQTPVALVFVSGGTRSGKSFSLNVLMHTEHSMGFPVGDEAHAETIGAAIWDTPLARCENHTIYVVDTEGLNTKTPTYDKVILVVGLMTAARFVYHDDGWLTYQTVVALRSVATLALHYGRRGVGKGNALMDQLLPHGIVWVLQRYKFDDTTEAPLDTLFRVMLAEIPNPYDATGIALFNSTVRAIREVFPNHTAHFIPAASNTSTPPPSSLPIDSLSPRYLRAMDQLRQDIANCDLTRPKGATFQRGSDIADLLQLAVAIANEEIDYIGDKVISDLTRRYMVAIIQNVTTEVSKWIMPQNALNLTIHLDRVFHSAHQTLLESIPSNSNASGGPSAPLRYLATEYTRELEPSLSHIREVTEGRNMAASDSLCRAMVELALNHLSSPQTIREMAGDIARFDHQFATELEIMKQACLGPACPRCIDSLCHGASIARDMVILDGEPRRKIMTLFVAICVMFIINSVVRPFLHTIFAIMVPNHRSLFTITVDAILIGITAICVCTVLLIVMSIWNISSLFDDIAVFLVTLTSKTSSVNIRFLQSNLFIGPLILLIPIIMLVRLYPQQQQQQQQPTIATIIPDIQKPIQHDSTDDNQPF